jgi:hypothetical protein
MTYDQWLIEVRMLSGMSFSLFNEWYSFESAFERGMTPARAVRNCRNWLSGR